MSIYLFVCFAYRLAYSCMMIMAEGFGQLISKSINQTEKLQKLSTGELGDEMLPSAFNVGYVGPEGPMVYDTNGDLTTGYVEIGENKYRYF